MWFLLIPIADPTGIVYPENNEIIGILFRHENAWWSRLGSNFEEQFWGAARHGSFEKPQLWGVQIALERNFGDQLVGKRFKT